MISNNTLPPTHDWLAREHAERLALRIKDYWQGQIDVWVVKIQPSNIVKQKRSTYAIRSNLVNGVPQKKRGEIIYDGDPSDLKVLDGGQ